MDSGVRYSTQDKETLKKFYLDYDALTSEQLNLFMRGIQNKRLTAHYDKDGSLWFNPNGVVRRSEVLQTLGDILKDRFSIEYTEPSIDGVTQPSDSYNSCYNALVPDQNSSFYGVYSREDLILGIKRIELAYMIQQLEPLRFAQGFAYLRYAVELGRYEDARKIPLRIPEYEHMEGLIPNGYSSIETYFKSVEQGDDYLHLGVVLLTIKLVQLLDEFETLEPLKSVTRLEFLTILEKLDLM